MLSISNALNASQAKTYHQMDYASATQSYYNKGGEVKGEWHGKMAASLGLSKEVSPLEFSRLVDGQHPENGEQMVRHRLAQQYKNQDGTVTKAVEHRAGWDAQFAPSKSVSLTALVGGDERIREAHREAVKVALSELESYTHARLGGNKPAEATGRFIAATFEHDTARPVDGYAAPQLHTHAVIFNVTEREDGSTRALQERPFFESQNYVGAVYQAELFYRLKNLGYEIERGKSGAPEIKGYSAEYLEASSQRSQKIREHMEQAGVSGPEAAQIAAHATREGKQNLTPQEVLEAHRKMAVEFGNEPQRVVEAARERARQQEQRPETASQAKEAVTFARESIFEREAVADKRAILTTALRRGMGEATFREVRDEFQSQRETGRFRSVESQKYDSERRFTTPETIAAERANVQYVLDGRNSVKPIMGAEQARKQANTKDFLNQSQRQAIEEVLNSSDRIHGLQGLAGTGKTTTLEIIRKGAERKDYKVEGFAPTAKAAGQLREAGVDATTLQSFLSRKVKATVREPEPKHLYMLDESSLASTRQMQAFLQKLKPEDRVLVIGDTRQHQAVDAGRPFQQMQEAGMQTSQLDKIMRQRDTELLKAVQHLANNETVKGIELLAEQGRVTEVKSAQDRIQAIAKDYAARPENTIIISPDNKSRQQINESVRAELLKTGTLAEDGKQLRTLLHRSDMTGADRTWAARYNPGEVLQYTTGSKTEGIDRNSFATVRSVDARSNMLTVEKQDGTTVSYDPKRLRGVNVFTEIEREFATGDRIQFTAGEKQLRVSNRDLATIVKLEDGKMTVELDGKAKRQVTFDTEKFRQFDHGYAVTSHSSQGLTAGRVLANIDTDSSRSLINSRLAYVAISRASEDARIYTNNAETLGQRLATDISKTAAVDFRPSTEQTREVVNAFRSNDPAKATELLQKQERVYEYANPDHRVAAVALDYTARPDRAVVVVPDSAERKELTQLIRAELQAQGKISAESHSVSVLVEQKYSNPKLAASYSPGDQIHYRTGSPSIEGIAHDSTATVLSSNDKKNLLTIETRDGEQVSYNPIHLRQQTKQSTVYRQGELDLAVGERITFNRPDRENRIRSGDFATLEKIGDNNTLTVRMDNGREVTLEAEKAKHIDYGHTVEKAKRLSADRIVLTGDSAQLAEQQAALTKLNPKIRDLAIYTSDSSNTLQKDHNIANESLLTKEGISNAPNLGKLSEPSSPAVEIEGYGIGM
nr:ATP-dependent exoDNAse (exonuclease V) alpha subunit - helicase superfamily I [uncultured bacterium]